MHFITYSELQRTGEKATVVCGVLNPLAVKKKKTCYTYITNFDGSWSYFAVVSQMGWNILHMKATSFVSFIYYCCMKDEMVGACTM